MAMMNPNHKEALKQVARRMRQEGGSLRHIARALGIHRQTVKKLLRETETEASSLVHPETKTKAAETSAALSPGNPSASGNSLPVETLNATQTPNLPPTPNLPQSLPAPAATPPKTKRPSKLDRFRSRILELATDPDLTNKEIRRTIRREGYTGGKTILDDFLRQHREKKMPRAYIRYEPPPGSQGQMDWSPYTVEFPGESGPPIKVKVHVFSMILSYSRYQYLEVFLDEKQDTLFQGHVEAFHYFGGVPLKILYDNQKVVTLGRLGGKVLLHPRFEAFAAHYAFTPALCLPGDAEAKGRVERPFRYLDTSFFPGRKFKDLQDLRQQLRTWLEGRDGEQTPDPEIQSPACAAGAADAPAGQPPHSDVVTTTPEPTNGPLLPAQTPTHSTDEQTGNLRIHGTTRERPVDLWAQEKPLLISLPTRIEQRPVARDCTVAVLGSRYTVPPDYVGQTVTVLITPKLIRFFNQRREPIAQHPVSPQKGKLVINEDHYDQLRKARKRETRNAIEERFLALFPEEHDFLDGLKRQVKSLAPIHLKQIDTLLERFTRDQVCHAIRQAIRHGACTATYLDEILRRQFPSQFSACSFDQKLEKPAGLALGHLEIGDAGHFDNIFNDPSPEHAEPPATETQTREMHNQEETDVQEQTDHQTPETGAEGQTDTPPPSTPTDERSQS